MRGGQSSAAKPTTVLLASEPGTAALLLCYGTAARATPLSDVTRSSNAYKPK